MDHFVLGCGHCMTFTAHTAVEGREDLWACGTCGAERCWGTRRSQQGDDPGGLYEWNPNFHEDRTWSLRLRSRALEVAYVQA